MNLDLALGEGTLNESKGLASNLSLLAIWTSAFAGLLWSDRATLLLLSLFGL